MPESLKVPRRFLPLLEAFGIALVLAGFGFLSQKAFYGALLLLAVCAWAISRHLGEREKVLEFFGLGRRKPFFPLWLTLGGISGILAWIGFYLLSGKPLPYPVFGLFVLTAAGIGFAEEFVYRGFLFSLLKPYGPTLTIAFTAFAHTAYKLALLAPHSEIRLGAIALWTILAGVALGALRHFSNSIWPAALNHVLFDVLVYGSGDSGPEWVW